MRGVLLICILLFGRYSLDAQLYFNKHYSRDGGYYYFTSLIEWRQQIFILAHYNDPSLNSNYGSSAILTLNLNGDLVSIDTIHPTLNHFFAWPESLQILDDSTLFYVAHDSSYYHVMEFNPSSKKTRIRSVACPLGKILYQKVIGKADPKNKYIVTNHVVRTRKRGGKPYKGIYDVVISKLNSSGEIIYKTLSNDTLDLVGWNIKQLRNNNLVVMGYTTNIDYDNKNDYIFQQFIYEFDSSLNFVRKIFSPEIIKSSRISDLIESKERALYCATSERNWIVQPLGGGNYWEDKPAVAKYDSSGNYLWTISHVTQAPVKHDIYNSLCFDKDSNNIIAVGRYNIRDDYGGIDSSRRILDKGIITKIDLDGNLVWNRFYAARGEEGDYNVSEFLDIKRISTNGYIICGSSDLADKQNRDLQGWLLKVDEEGCLIPGCNLVKITIEDKIFNIKIFPNPASEFISLIHGYYEDLNLEFINEQGQIINRIVNIQALETNIIPVGKLLTGEYILNLKNKGGILKYSTKLLICN